MTDWVVDVVERLGAVGVGILILMENLLPPIPSEIILPFAGFAAEQGKLNPIGAWIAATTGSLVGAWVLYGIGAKVGEERIRELSRKRWFIFFGEKDFDRGDRFFERHGGAVVFFGRFIPLVRSIVSVPAGLERMSLVRFTVFTAIGSGIWNAAFITAGWVLGDKYDRVERYVGPVSKATVALLAVVAIVLIVRKGRQVSVVRRGRRTTDT